MILVCVAHSDDEVLGCGGTIAKYVCKGEKVVSLIFSHDQLLFDKRFISRKRKRESQQASKLLGHETHFLNIHESQLPKILKNGKMRAPVIALIKKYKPRIIFTHSPDDPHPAHRALFQFISSLVKENKLKILIYTFIISSPLKLSQRNKPSLYIDISDAYKLKEQAIKQFRSQKYWLLYYRLITYLSNRIAGIKSGHKYAEVFYKW